MATANIITIEKGAMGNLNYPNVSYDDHQHVDGGNSTTALPVRAYIHHPAPQPRAVANAAPLGLFSVAGTLFIVSLNGIVGRGPSMPNGLISVVCLTGGLTQTLVGLWDYATGNTFGASVFLSYGTFWTTYAIFLSPFLGVADTYAGNPGDLSTVLGIFLASWFILTFVFFLGTIRTNLVSVLLFFFLEFTFLFLMISEFTGNSSMHKAGGWAGLATAITSFYAGAAQLLTKDNFLCNLPVGHLQHRMD